MITREKMVAQFTFLVWKEFLRWLRAAILLRTDCPHCQRCLFVVENMVIRSWRFKNGGLERECYTSENVYSRSVLYGAPWTFALFLCNGQILELRWDLGLLFCEPLSSQKSVNRLTELNCVLPHHLISADKNVNKG